MPPVPPAPQEKAPETVRDLAAWPDELRSAVALCGPDVVWSAGLAVLGYPPTWIDSGKGVRAVLQRLRQDGFAIASVVALSKKTEGD